MPMHPLHDRIRMQRGVVMRASDQQEKAIRLYLEENLSYRAVAVKMQLPRDTVKSWVRRYRRANGLIAESPVAKKIMKNAQSESIASNDYEKRNQTTGNGSGAFAGFSLRGRKKVDKKIIYNVIYRRRGKVFCFPNVRLLWCLTQRVLRLVQKGA